MAELIRRGQDIGFPTRGMWDPFRLFREMLRYDPFRGMLSTEAPEMVQGFIPDFDIKETKDNYVFKADLPGIQEKDLDISITGNRLTIKGKRESEEVSEGESYYCAERSYGSFSRTFGLPDDADPDKAQVELKHGVLNLSIPKKPEAKPKKIEVRAEG